jgi:hypothetical protein
VTCSISSWKNDSSQRKHVATHLLEIRRNRELTNAAQLSAAASQSSAKATWVAAVIAGVSGVVAVLALYFSMPK